MRYTVIVDIEGDGAGVDMSQAIATAIIHQGWELWVVATVQVVRADQVGTWHGKGNEIEGGIAR